jgi:hypothetical protein
MTNNNVIFVDFKNKVKLEDPEPTTDLQDDSEPVIYDFVDGYNGLEYHFDSSIKGGCPDHVPIPFYIKGEDTPVVVYFTLESLQQMTKDMIELLTSIGQDVRTDGLGGSETV